jgi:stage III sporulation protein AE
MMVGEFLQNTQLIRQLLIVAILGALMRCLTENFSNKSADLGFYVTYLIAALLAVSSFQISVGILTSLVNTINAMMLASVPIMVGVMATSGNFAGAAAFHPLMFVALQVIVWFISNIFIPLVLAAAALDIVNQLADGNRLDKLAILLNKVAGYALKIILAAFAFLLTLQRFSAPIVNNLALRTTRSAVGTIPVVGNALNAAVDTVVHFGQAARSGLLVALVVVICAALAAPLVKMAVIAWVYRLTAGFIQPVADPRLVNCMDSIGRHMGSLFTAAALVGVMCVYTVIILLSF